MLNLKYYLGTLLVLPCLPFMYLDGKRIRSKVPKLPEATHPEGLEQVRSKKTLSLITIGESTVAGVGVKRHADGFTGTLAKEIAAILDTNVRWKVYAKSGYTAKQVNDHLLPAITEKDVDLIVVGLGGNDAFLLNSPATWKKNVTKLTQQLKAMFPDTPIAFTNMPPIKEFPAFTNLIKFTIGNLVEILGKELQTLTKDHDNLFYNDEIITLGAWTTKFELTNEPSDFFSDGVHPSKLTYQTWAEDFTNFLLEQSNLRKTLVNALN